MSDDDKLVAKANELLDSINELRQALYEQADSGRLSPEDYRRIARLRLDLVNLASMDVTKIRFDRGTD